MVDFLMISTRSSKRGTVEIYPRLIIKKSNDLMIRGGDFYAIWIEERGLWSTDEEDALQLIDRELDKYAEENRQKFNDTNVKVLHMWDAETGMIDRWHNYCKKQMRDSFHMLDEKLIFSNTKCLKKDYASKKLPYALEAGDYSAYDKLMSTLYSDEERHKIEWAIGSIVSGDSKKIQKFMVLYGAAGTGKSTVLNIIQQLFEGYYSVFDAKSLGSSNNSFALEAFKTNPLVAIQHDGDLSRIEDNTRLNSLVSHELMTVNEKFKATYANRFKAFLFMGTNKPVKITDAKSGLIRRLIDVSPTGEKLPPKEYRVTMKQIGMELGAIAQHCLDIYQEDPSCYDDYVPTNMLGASNDFYNFVEDSYFIFKKDNSTTLKAAWAMYKQYCDDAKVTYPFSQRIFKEELKNYFHEFHDRYPLNDGTRARSYYLGFKTDIFDGEKSQGEKSEKTNENWLKFNCTKSIFDKVFKDYPAQLASERGTPMTKWSECTTTLKDIDTKQLHYVKGPKNLIFIDFDIPDETGKKCFQKNLEAVLNGPWPPTYAELSKSGEGIHLYYLYSGDATQLSRVYADHIEIKVSSGNSSIRRMVTKCNNLEVATISSGLPMKEVKMTDFKGIENEKHLRALITKALRKEIFPNTKPSIDYIKMILDEAYANKDFHYDVSDMHQDILIFAANSSNQSGYCIKTVNKMKFHSDDISPDTNNEDEAQDPRIVFYDVEVFPNLFLINWKFEGKENKVVRMINPTAAQVESLMKLKLVGFNCRRYDNHMLYARLMGYSNEQLYHLSQRIVSGDKNAFFREAYNISYTDIYDFSSKKQSLKKFEIELHIHHQELGLPWDKPVPEELWPKVAKYCDNDVLATEAVWNARKADFAAREIIAAIADRSVNTPNNTISGDIIFGNDKNPQSKFNYRDLGGDPDAEYNHPTDDEEVNYDIFDDKGRPIFPGYTFDAGHSRYRGEDVGEGGYVYAEPGIYWNVALLDIASMHPHSIIAENLFGEYTKNFETILNLRLLVKHREFDKAKSMLNELVIRLHGEDKAKDIMVKVSPYFCEEYRNSLSKALKIVINAVYGMTDASFENRFRDPRNKDNIVAKRGALFMINLKHKVQEQGYTVAHIKTDSIKIPDATPEIIKFVMDYGKKYGYTFEHEATYDRMCLVNNAVYIARFATPEKCKKLYGYSPDENTENPFKWTATGTQFAVPYVFKTLFSKEDILFEDKCEVKSVTSALYLDMNEDLPDVSLIEDERAKYLKEHANNIDLDIESKYAADISKGHNYVFIGKVGNFCPMKAGSGGGLLVREGKDKYGFTTYPSATGAKGYRWLEAEMVEEQGKQDLIDERYYRSLVDDAVDAISKYGDFEQFVSDEPTTDILEEFMRIPDGVPEEIPFE